ncbi:hypothetical protein NDU88_005943 [Pleurodeles waltl]|uniref:Uncharacterized protein n=1 Tax=Pleurodeles waltl TaxID=8319 RepID=A0AAV7X107_PLEWA|nr:hypothetical protein NDU88_005943 [Pleurodeles waltl]
MPWRSWGGGGVRRRPEKPPNSALTPSEAATLPIRARRADGHESVGLQLTTRPRRGKPAREVESRHPDAVAGSPRTPVGRPREPRKPLFILGPPVPGRETIRNIGGPLTSDTRAEASSEGRAGRTSGSRGREASTVE